MLRSIILTCSACLILAPLGTASEPASDRAKVDLPPDRVGPVPVEVDLFVLDVTEVDGAGERFTGSIYLNLTWKDPRLAFDPKEFGGTRAIYTGDEASGQLETIWSPGITITNLVSDPQIDNKALTISSDGSVMYEVRMIGQFSSPMTLQRFPFDTQLLAVRLESFLWEESELRLEETDARGHVNEKLGLRGWKLDSIRSQVGSEKYPTGEVYSLFTSELVVKREPWFIIWGVVFPLILVTFFGVTCFFWDQETLSERVAQALTCLLTAAAMNLAVSTDLPKVAYFTSVDLVILLTYATLVVIAVESIVVKFIHARDAERADRVDLTCGWVVPLVYLAGVAGIFALR